MDDAKFTSIHKKFHFHTTILPWLKFLVDGSEFLVDGSAWKYPFLNMVADSGCMFSAWPTVAECFLSVGGDG